MKLPPRVYAKHGAWYFVDTARKWHKLCRQDAGEAGIYRALAVFVEVKREPTFPVLIRDWQAAKLRNYSRDVQSDYAQKCGVIARAFIDFDTTDVRPADIATFLDDNFSEKHNTGNKYKGLLSVIFAFGVRRGERDDNPAKQVAGFSERPRDRYITDDELHAIRSAAQINPALAVAIDLAYYTGQRWDDLANLKWSSITATHINFKPGKTVNSSGAQLAVRIHQPLAETLATARNGRVTGIYVIHTRNGQKSSYTGMHSAWVRTIARAKKGREEGFLHDAQFRDLRAKALTDISRAMNDKAAQRLGGHTTEEMTSAYLRRAVLEVDPVPKLSNFQKAS